MYSWMVEARAQLGVTHVTEGRDGLRPLGFPLQVLVTEQDWVAVCRSLRSAGGERPDRTVRLHQGCQICDGEFVLEPLLQNFLKVTEVNTASAPVNLHRWAAFCSGGSCVRGWGSLGQRSGWSDLPGENRTWLTRWRLTLARFPFSRRKLKWKQKVWNRKKQLEASHGPITQRKQH